MAEIDKFTFFEMLEIVGVLFEDHGIEITEEDIRITIPIDKGRELVWIYDEEGDYQWSEVYDD